MLNPVVAHSTVGFYDNSLAGIAGSNLNDDMYICVLLFLCVV